MRKLLLIVSVLLIITSCKDDNKPKKIILPQSSGKLNSVAVVIDNELWENTVGDVIRETLAAPIDGLPQMEPIFSMNQIPSHIFTGNTRNNRNIIKIEKGKEAGIKIFNNKYARPQKLIVVSGQTLFEIKSEIKKNGDKIITAFKNQEIKEKQRRTSQSLHKNNSIKKDLGIDIKFSSVYRIANTLAKKEDKFKWIKRDISTGSVNLLLYELPLTAINKEENIVSQVIKMRDSIGAKYIAGPIEGSHMITDNKYTPHFYETTIDNKPTFESIGKWEVNNGVWKAGPFINYIIEDKANDRYIVAEGFIDAPSINKREYMLELESMIKSIKTN